MFVSAVRNRHNRVDLGNVAYYSLVRLDVTILHNGTKWLSLVVIVYHATGDGCSMSLYTRLELTLVLFLRLYDRLLGWSSHPTEDKAIRQAVLPISEPFDQRI